MEHKIMDATVTSNPTFEKLSKNLPNLKKISIRFYKSPKNLTPSKFKKTWNLQSFKDIPEKLPALERFEFFKSYIINFEDLTAEMPKLKYISFYNCSIQNFRGFHPNFGFSAQHTQINSFEGLDLPIPQNIYKDEDSNTIIKEKHISLQNCTIRSLGGVSRSTLQALLIAILSKDYPEKKYNDNVELEDPEFHKNRLHQIKLDLHPTALKLIQESINSEIERRYSPKYNKFWPRIEGQSEPFPEELPVELRSQTCIRIPDFFVMDWKLFHLSNMYNRYEEMELHAQKPEWIYGFNLMEKLFIPENLNHLHEYFKKTTQQLAQDYITTPENIPPEQIERLVHEINPQIRKILENNLPPSDSIIKRISTKFSFRTENGLTILK